MHQDLIDSVDIIFNSLDSEEKKKKSLNALRDAYRDECDSDDYGTPQTVIEINQYWDELQQSKKTTAKKNSSNSNTWEQVFAKLERYKNGKGNIMAQTANLVDILSEHPSFKGTLKFNEFSYKYYYKNEEMKESHYARLKYDICRELKVDFRAQDIQTYCHMVAEANRFHPVRDYLNGLTWDGTDRMTQFVEVLKIESNKLNVDLLTKWMIACVARVMKPGCKVDSVPIIFGATSTRKSTAIKTLVPNVDWHTSEHVNFGSKDSKQLVIGKWIVELPELSSISAKDTNLIKADLTLTADEFRKPYGKVIEKFDRQFLYIGTTNDDEFMRDPTSNRRFWIFSNQGFIDTDAIESMRDQLWAQATKLYISGATWHLDKDQEAEMSEIATGFEIKDAWYDAIVDYLNDENDFKKSITTSKILNFIKPNIAQQDNKDRFRVQRVMNFLKWKSTSIRLDGKVQQGWKRPDPNVRVIELPQPIEINDWN